MSYTPPTQTFLDVSQTTSDQIWTNNRKILAANNVFNTDGGAGSTFTQQVWKSAVVTAASTTFTATSVTCEYASAGNGNMFLSLPAAGANVDKIFMVEKIDSAATTVYLVPNGTDTIKGSAVWYPISTQYAWVIIQSDGSGSWKIIGQYTAASGGGGAPTTDTYVLYPTSDTPNLPNSRTAAAGKNIFFTDGGAGSTLTIETNPVTATSGATTNLTATSNSVLIVNASGGAAIVNLPAVSGNANKKFTIKKVDSSANTVTVTANGSDTIDGSTSQVLTIQYQSQDIIAGTTANQWNIV